MFFFSFSLDNIFTNAEDRPNVHKVIVVLTDGNSPNSTKAVNLAMLARRTKGIVITVYGK